MKKKSEEGKCLTILFFGTAMGFCLGMSTNSGIVTMIGFIIGAVMGSKVR